MTCIAIKLAYNGSAYSGFAKQKDPNINTIQGKLESALKIVFRRDIDTVCAGRTDAGVHALGQVVSFEAPQQAFSEDELLKLKISLNALTPDDIVVKVAWQECEGFSARFSADVREYRYRICTGNTPPLFLQKFSWWHRGVLDIEKMQQAANYLVGEHDFKSFCKVQSAKDKNTIRTIHCIEFFEEQHLGEECICMRIVGNAFLHSMVRTIVGTLEQVGTGKREPIWVKEVLEAKDRKAAGQNAPACGLVFHEVRFKEGAL